jgi:hypothetical protein
MQVYDGKNSSRPNSSDNSDSSPQQRQPTGIRGWLLVLCLMFTIVGPLISTWLMIEEYEAFAPHVVGSRGLQVTLLASMLAAMGSTLFGIYAGLRLWMIQASAVRTAKIALLIGLAADILITAIDVVAGATRADADLLSQTLFHLVPSLIFFTICFAYLQRSHRVYVTFRPKDLALPLEPKLGVLQ